MSKIVIIGAGAMGSAFALPCLDNNHDINIVGTHLENDFIDKLKLETVTPNATGAATHLSPCNKPGQWIPFFACINKTNATATGDAAPICLTNSSATSISSLLLTLKVEPRANCFFTASFLYFAAISSTSGLKTFIFI